MSLAVSVLQNTIKIYHITKGDIFQIRISHSDEKIWWKCSYVDFTRVSGSLTCWLSKEFLLRCFLKSGLTKSFRVCNFRNKVAMTIMFFFKMFKIWCRFQKLNGKKQKKLLALKIIDFELGTRNSHNPEKDICHWQSMCYETTLRFKISPREIFSKSGCPIVMKKYDENALIQISQDFATL